MPRYAAFLRGVSPSNAKMPELKRAFEAAGFTEVKTVLSSGNVVFDARRASESALERKAEAAMRELLGQAFLTIVRPVDVLQALLATDPYRRSGSPPPPSASSPSSADEPAARIALPIEQDGARLLALVGRELFSAYGVTPKGPVFMTLIERAFGKEVTTRTWDTVGKVARA